MLVLLTLPEVRSTGPTPRIPSILVKPLDELATPMDCWLITKSGDNVIVSSSMQTIWRNHKLTTVSPVFLLALVGVYGLFAPTNVLTLPVSIRSVSRITQSGIYNGSRCT